MQLFIETWEEFKTLITQKKASMQYITRSTIDGLRYEIFFVDGGIQWVHSIAKEDTAPDPSDQKDFEDNYQSSCNAPIEQRSSYGRTEIQVSSRPVGERVLTCFSDAGDKMDSPQAIHGGKDIFWDFSNSDDIVTDSITTAIPSGFKRKRLILTFLDTIWLKEGFVRWMGAQKGSYMDFFIIAPTGYPYLDNSNSVQFAVSDTPFEHYISKFNFFGDNPIGTYLDTESAQDVGMASGYQVWIEITVPTTDILSYGCGTIEMYRERNIII